MKKIIIAPFMLLILSYACISKQEYKALQAKLSQEAGKNQNLVAENQKIKKENAELANSANFLKTENATLKNEITKLKEDITFVENKLQEKIQNSFGEKEKLWSDSRYQAAKTAAKEEYLSKEEQNIYYYLNLARMNPSLFAETFLEKYIQEDKFNDNPFTRSLFNDLKNQEPLPLVKPNRKLWELAHCHALESGKTGYTGHERNKTCSSQGFDTEACYYGNDAYSGLKIVLHLLIDAESPSYDNRRALMGKYENLGASVQLHKTRSYNAVLNFK